MRHVLHIHDCRQNIIYINKFKEKNARHVVFMFNANSNPLWPHLNMMSSFRVNVEFGDTSKGSKEMSVNEVPAGLV